ncbi:YciI family protein [Jongsikchunia kroppenstedtii]|uniref:YciI family protein n=1 Tax=Jongsikchunia kroppenstedtii TaxID=1121721 RepID=UPI000364FA75|nr:YciI family protein [Jongsikchunia kroppenstedtii]
MRYVLTINNAEPAEGEIPADAIAQMEQAFDVYAKALASAGVFVAAEILQPVAATTTVTRRDGELRVQDGPFADTKEVLAGVFVIDVPDLDAALAWAEKCPATQYAVIEVRASAITAIDGVWQ